MYELCVSAYWLWAINGAILHPICRFASNWLKLWKEKHHYHLCMYMPLMYLIRAMLFHRAIALSRCPLVLK